MKLPFFELPKLSSNSFTQIQEFADLLIHKRILEFSLRFTVRTDPYDLSSSMILIVEDRS